MRERIKMSNGKMLNSQQDFDVSENLASKVQGHLDDVPEPDAEDFADVSQREPEEEPEEEEELEEEEESEEKEEKDKPALPESYFRAAVHSDWTPEEIQEFYEANPEKALKTFKKIFDSTNAVTQQFAEFGRMHQKQTQEALEAERKKKDAEKDEFKGIDIDAFEKQHGEDNPAAVALLKAMNEQNKTLHSEIVELRKSRAQVAGTELSDEDVKIWNDITNFFDSKDLEAYNEFYGKPEKNQPWNQVLTGEQMRRRMEVITMADQVRAGARLKGEEMDRNKALQFAHLALSDAVREAVIRNDLKGKLKKRSKGITVKSTGRKSKDDMTSAKRSEERATKKVKKRLAKLFGGDVE